MKKLYYLLFLIPVLFLMGNFPGDFPPDVTNIVFDNLSVSQSIAINPSEVTLTSDDQSVSTSNISFLKIYSDNATATNRTFTLTNGITGQQLLLHWSSGTNRGELSSGGSNVIMHYDWTPTAIGHTLSLKFNGTKWVEEARRPEPEMVGDSGSGGVTGLVPAPGAGDATKALLGDGSYSAIVTDPSTTKGDLIVRDASALDRLPVDTNSYVLVADSTQTLGIKWDPIGHIVRTYLRDNGLAYEPWTSFTATLSCGTCAKGTIVRDNAYWRRVGQNMEIMWDYEQSAAGTAGTGNYLLTVPNSKSINTSLVAVTTDAEIAVGHGIVANSADAEATIAKPLEAVPNDSTHFAFVFSSSNANSLDDDRTYVSNTTTGNFGATVSVISIRISVPISGWGAIKADDS